MPDGILKHQIDLEFYGESKNSIQISQIATIRAITGKYIYHVYYDRNGRDLPVFADIFGLPVKFYTGMAFQDSIKGHHMQKLETFVKTEQVFACWCLLFSYCEGCSEQDISVMRGRIDFIFCSLVEKLQAHYPILVSGS